jgi:hypothetical protein
MHVTKSNVTTDQTDDLRGWRRWASTGIIGALSVGLLAVWLIPGNAADAQNREILPFPSFSPTSAADPATYHRVDAALRDRIGAQVAVSEALGSISVHVLGRSPTSAVTIGADGQPFFSEDFLRPCRETEETLAVVKAGLAEDQASMNAAGKYVLFMLAPDKSSIRRSVVDSISPNLLKCSDFVRAHFEAWEAEGTLPLITLWDAVGALDEEPGTAYMWNDTHWNTAGSMAMSRTLMERLVIDQQVPAAILDDLNSPVVSDEQPYTTDLNQVMGLSDIDYRTTASFVRPDVATTGDTTVAPSGSLQLHYSSTSASSALVPGKTLILGDSFMLTQMPTQLANFFEDVTFADHHEFSQAGEFDRVIVERVQRYGATGDWPSLTSAMG